jgi:hypothetical protein
MTYIRSSAVSSATARTVPAIFRRICNKQGRRQFRCELLTVKRKKQGNKRAGKTQPANKDSMCKDVNVRLSNNPILWAQN